MTYLSFDKFSKNFGEKILFDNVSMQVNEGDKIALIARNGSGKTSLLRMVAGLESLNTGAKMELNKKVRIGYLEQAPHFADDKTIEEIIYMSDSENVNVVRQYDHAMATHDEQGINNWLGEMERLQLWDLEARIKEILGKLALHDVTQTVKTLSGGQRKRLALAQMLIDNPEFLIFDEPTNHLDPPMIEWLEDWLTQERITLLLVTHDRYFLDNVCNQIIELDGGNLYKYAGNYSDYLEKKNMRYENDKANIEKAKNLYRKELDWIRKQPKARGTKAKARVDAFDVVEKKAKTKIDDERVKLEIDANRIGTKVLEFHNVCKAYGDKIMLDKFSYKFQRFEKIGIAGRNGVGKSTFIKMVIDEVQPDSGSIIVGETIKIGHYSQEGMKLPQDMRALEVVQNIASYIPLKGGKTLSASQLLERFLFTHDDQFTYVSKLSGGEQRRLQLLCVLMDNPNFLILDEPTNDLDLHTLMALEDFLEDFPGSAIIITHDRYFLDKVVDHIFIFEGAGKVHDYNGKISEFQFDNYKDKKGSSLNEVDKKDVPAAKSGPIIKKVKLSYKEQRELELLPDEISKLDTEKAALEQALLEHTIDYVKVKSISDALVEKLASIDTKTLRWLQLSELVGE